MKFGAVWMKDNGVDSTVSNEVARKSGTEKRTKVEKSTAEGGPTGWEKKKAIGPN